MPPKVLANFCARHNFLVMNLSPKVLIVHYSSVCPLPNNEVARSSHCPVGLNTEKCLGP